jgi:pantothenate kinase type III
MLLVVDAGNTNVVVAVNDGESAAFGESPPSRSAPATNMPSGW